MSDDVEKGSKFSWELGDITIEDAPTLPKELTDMLIPPALKALDKLRGRGPLALHDMEVQEPPVPLETLDEDKTYTMVCPKHLIAVVDTVDRQQVRDFITGDTPMTMPVIVVFDHESYVYEGLEQVMAKRLLGAQEMLATVKYA